MGRNNLQTSLVVFQFEDGTVDVFERIEDTYWNRVEYRRPANTTVVGTTGKPGDPALWAAAKFVANQAVSLLLGWAMN